ncbi:hypothetical protein ASG91_16190 [Phycicoccus sp. Soil802]|nr:hypothetical protein ASG91_16190 [Phycicoccus sp. Soil802]
MSLVIWSAAMKDLCSDDPTPRSNTIAAPLWLIVVGVLVGLPVLLWLLSWLVSFLRVGMSGPAARKDASEFIRAWEAISLVPVGRLDAGERGAVRALMADWRTENRMGPRTSAWDYLRLRFGSSPSREAHTPQDRGLAPPRGSDGPSDPAQWLPH